MSAEVSAERFRREIQLGAQLQHPHIVPLLSAGASSALLYYSMPFVAGESLRERLSRGPALSCGESVRIWRDVLDALSYAHSRGIVHRDIKPENILLSNKHALVTDFGIARAIQAATGESADDVDRPRARHAGVHGARAGGRRSQRRRARRHLLRRPRDVRDARRPFAVRGRLGATRW